MLGSLLLEEFFPFFLFLSLCLFSPEPSFGKFPFCTLNLLVGYILGEFCFIFFFSEEAMHN